MYGIIAKKTTVPSVPSKRSESKSTTVKYQIVKESDSCVELNVKGCTQNMTGTLQLSQNELQLLLSLSPLPRAMMMRCWDGAFKALLFSQGFFFLQQALSATPVELNQSYYVCLSRPKSQLRSDISDYHFHVNDATPEHYSTPTAGFNQRHACREKASVKTNRLRWICLTKNNIFFTIKQLVLRAFSTSPVYHKARHCPKRTISQRQGL